jgi:hypothetical protein
MSASCLSSPDWLRRSSPCCRSPTPILTGCVVPLYVLSRLPRGLGPQVTGPQGSLRLLPLQNSVQLSQL